MKSGVALILVGVALIGIFVSVTMMRSAIPEDSIGAALFSIFVAGPIVLAGIILVSGDRKDGGTGKREDRLRPNNADRRIREGRCYKCGYDLRGNESGRCPECSARIERA